jgi:hypothetical protein
MTFADARERLATWGMTASTDVALGDADEVWLVTMTGHFPGVFRGTLYPQTPTPVGAEQPCRIAAAVIREPNAVFFAGSAPSGECAT